MGKRDIAILGRVSFGTSPAPAPRDPRERTKEQDEDQDLAIRLLGSED
jgi:hypothetical protein